MGLCAQVRLFTPLSPVPFTAQTFGAILIGGVLGAELGVLSIVLYVALGVAGVPWFAKAPAGSWELVNAVTAGYIGGFALAAGFVGLMTDRFERARRHVGLFLVMLAGAALVYVPGVAVLMAVTGRPLGEAIGVGALVFLPWDAVKALAAAGLASAVLPARAAPGGPAG
jgi:biotin transport system substrate-specific component